MTRGHAWPALAVIAVALVLVLVAPLIISARLRALRAREINLLAPALVRLNDWEAALATEAAARGEETQPSASSHARTTADAARTAAAADEAELQRLVREIGPEAVALFTEARIATGSWRAGQDTFDSLSRRSTPPDAALLQARTSRWQSLELALADMQRLEDDLNARATTLRSEIVRMEHIDVLVPAALVPLALLALFAVALTARNTMRLTREAAEGRHRAEQALASRSALMRGVTHDLKNPLGAAVGFAELLADGTVGPPLPDAQDKVVQRLRRLLSVTLETVNDLVELSRADTGDLRIARSATSVDALLKEAVDDYVASAGKAGIRLVLDFGVTNAVVETDAVRVRQVLGNLLSNAVKYTPAGSEVRVRVENRADEVLGPVVAIDVADTGPGIPEDLRERVFEEFFRVPTTVSVAKGTGVGLAIARRVARLLGGDLRLGETAGGGATFTLLLPQTDSRSGS